MATMEPFNRGDVSPFLDLLDPDVKWVTGQGLVEGRDAAAELIEQLRAEGWTEHRITSISGQGPIMVSTFVNVFNGGEYAGGGAGVFNDAGRVVSMASLDENWSPDEGQPAGGLFAALDLALVRFPGANTRSYGELIRTTRIVLRDGPHDGWEAALPWDSISGLEFDNMLPRSVRGTDGCKLLYQRRGAVESREDDVDEGDFHPECCGR